MRHALLYGGVGVLAALASLRWIRARHRDHWWLMTLVPVPAALLAGEVASRLLMHAAGADALAIAAAALAGIAAADGATGFGAPAARLGGLLAALSLAALLIAMWAHPFPNLPFYRDSGAYSFLGIRLLHGQLPHRDLWDQKPGLVALVDAIILAGARDVPQRLFAADLLVSLGALAALLWGLRPLGSRWGIAAAGLWTICFYRLDNVFQGGNLLEQYALVPMFMAIGCGLRSLRGDGPLWALGLGALAGVAGLLKPTAASALPGFLVALLVIAASGGRRREALTMAVAAAGGAIAICGVYFGALLLAQTKLSTLYENLVVVNRIYGSGLTRANLAAALRSVQIDHWQLTIPAVALVAAGLFAVLERRHRAVAGFLVGAAAADLVGLVSPGYFYGHYFMLLVPSGALAIAAAIASGADALGRWSEAAARLAAGAGALAALLAVAAQFPITDMIAAPRAPGASIRAPLSDTAEFVNAICPTGQPIAVWASDPQLYVLAGRASSSRYFYTTTLQVPGYSTRRRVAEYVGDLAARPPCAIVDGSPDDAEVPPLDNLERLGWRYDGGFLLSDLIDLQPIFEYVTQHYRRLAVTADGLEVYVPLKT